MGAIIAHRVASAPERPFTIGHECLDVLPSRTEGIIPAMQSGHLCLNDMSQGRLPLHHHAPEGIAVVGGGTVFGGKGNVCSTSSVSVPLGWHCPSLLSDMETAMPLTFKGMWR